MRRVSQCFFALAIACAALTAFAQNIKSETITKIRASGVIHIGHRREAIPFSYIPGPSGQPIGYTISICDRIVSSLRTQLKLANLKVQYHAVLAETRVSMVSSGRVDLECGSTSNTASRRKEVDFSVATFAPTTRVLVPKYSPIRRMIDLNGHSVAVTKGSNSEAILEQVIEKTKLKLTKVPHSDNESSYSTFRSAQANALILNDVLIIGLVTKWNDRGRFEFIDEAIPAEPFGIMLRRNDPEFKAMIDKAINEMIDNGVMAKLYLQWFRTPIPPKRMNLDLPLTQDMAKILKLVPR